MIIQGFRAQATAYRDSKPPIPGSVVASLGALYSDFGLRQGEPN